ncbi:aspartate--tRNA(Asn) ligase [Leucobacter luti]|uniref:Aspartate--tRNA ligase n=1 Tax=Leucobacter luti TaxID=340320 RepID=A0A4R6RWF3_9MICO|nr:aspartate--tRNA(Asn) ligase [Leucobacter luti]MCW2289644.1 aspartyl-tRNA synthetase [Leucobacter luti]TCK37815.1 aspartyl-tRNA synthetase [Leucobacter luti]TDP90807.1 aspartyl-tRNA synthetase [Leucobacter luti]
MTERVLIKDLAAHEDGTVTVSGWVEKVRDQRYVQFVVLRDESGAVQLVNGGVLREPDPENPRSDILVPRTTTISELTHGTFLTVTGELQHNERVKLGGVEIQIESIEVITKSLPDNPVAEDSGIDVRLDWRFLDLRRPEQNLVFRIQTTFLHALRNVWVERGFIEIQTPKLMASASESRAELFEVEYFEGKAFLAQSPQFFKQMAQAAGFGGIFEVGPAFRADHSFTSRHATEFTSIDTELSWIDSHEDVMELHEELIVAGLTAVREKHGEEVQKLFGIEITVPSRPFPRIPLAEAKELVKARGYEVPRADADMDPEGERQIAAWAKEEHGNDFVFLTDYDSSIRPFYHMRHEGDAHLTKSYDLIYRGTEISTGAQREHRIDVLEAQARDKGMDPAELSFYLDFFRYGVPPHGGFGMGLNRVLMLMLEQSSIREVTYLFRGPNRLLP